MTHSDYIALYLRELGSLVNVGGRNALHCAEAAYADDPNGDPVEAAQSEADEWRRAS